MTGTRTFCQGEALRIAIALSPLRTEAQRTGHDFGDASFRRVANLLELANLILTNRMHTDDVKMNLRHGAPRATNIAAKTSQHVIDTLAIKLADADATNGFLTLSVEQIRNLLDDAATLRTLTP